MSGISNKLSGCWWAGRRPIRCRKHPAWQPLWPSCRRGRPGATLQTRCTRITTRGRSVRGGVAARRPRPDRIRCGTMSFASDDLERIAQAIEVELETQAPDGPAHRVVIWIVVDGEDAFIRSYRGPGARWYREALANPAVALHVDGRRLTATAIPATDPDSIER